MTTAQLDAFRARISGQMQCEQVDQLGSQIDCLNVLQGYDQEKRVEDLRKILILAGLRCETDLNDPDTIALVSKVLENFDPSQAMNEDEALFGA